MEEISPEVQSILEQVALQEAQKRLTLGQQAMLRNQALQRAGQIRGQQVLKAMAQDAARAQAQRDAENKLRQMREEFNRQQEAKIMKAVTDAAGTALVAGAGLDKAEPEVEQVEGFVGPPVPPELSAQRREAVSRAVQLRELGKLEAQLAEDPRERMRILREYANMAALEGVF